MPRAAGDRKSEVASPQYIPIRLFSLLAMLLLAIILVTGLLLILSNPGLTVLFGISSLGMLWGAWLIFSARGSRFWLGILLSSLALAGMIGISIIFFAQPKNIDRLVVFVGVSFVYWVLVAYIAQGYWHSHSDYRYISRSHQLRPLLLVNPKAGDGRALKANIPAQARSRGIRVIVLETGQNMARLVERAINQGVNVLGISGGDGSLGPVAQLAIKHNLPMVVLPGGTRCHFARDLGLDPAHIADALDGFRGIERRVDVGLIGDRVFLNNASFGLYADITSHSAYRQHKVEVARIVMQSLVSSRQPYYPLKFKDDTGANWDWAAFVLVAVNRYEILSLGEPGQRHRLDEGILQVVAVRALDDQILRQLISYNNLGVTDHPAVKEWTTTAFTITHPAGVLNVGVDGESCRIDSPAELHVLPRALRLLVPANSIGQRPVSPLSITGAVTLRDLILAKRRIDR